MPSADKMMSRHSRRDIPVGSLRRYGVRSATAGQATLRVELGDPSGTVLPEIGCVLDVSSDDLDTTVIERARTLRPSHLRVDIDVSSESRSKVLDAAHRASVALGAPLELAVAGVDAAPAGTLTEWIERAHPGIDVTRVIAVGDDAWLPSPEIQGQIRDAIRTRWRDASIVAGARTNFDIVNRDWTSIGDVDGISFGVQPQWHAEDDLSLIETLDGQADVARSARSRMGDRLVAISPVTLGPDYEGKLADPRHRSLFAAVWTVGSIHKLANEGIDSVTYFRLHGPAGLMDAGQARTHAETSRSGPVYPCFHVFADLAAAGGSPVLETTWQGDYPASTLAIDGQEERRIMVGSFAPVPVELSVAGLDDGPWHLRILDRSSAEVALYEPEHFRAEWSEVSTQDGVVRAELGPYGTVTLTRRHAH